MADKQCTKIDISFDVYNEVFDLRFMRKEKCRQIQCTNEKI